MNTLCKHIITGSLLFSFCNASVHANLFGGLGKVLEHKDQISSVLKVGKKAVTASKDIQPDQEYTVGRNIAAQVLAKYPPIEDATLIKKVNLIGQALAFKSDRPSIFNGYSFMVVQSEEPNGFATPGGHVFITKAMIDLCESDDHLAAILSHEVGHVVAGHGAAIIKKSRQADLLLTAGSELAQHKGGDDASLFAPIAKDLLQKVVEKGYGREQELEADGIGIITLQNAGFKPEAMIEMLSKIEKKFGMLDLPFFKSHPRPEVRIAHAKKVIETGNPVIGLSLGEKLSNSSKASEPEEKPKSKKFSLFGRR